VIALPFNDLRCLGSITEVVAELVAHRDDVLLELAEKYRRRMRSPGTSAPCRSATTTVTSTTAPRSIRASRRSGCGSPRPTRTASNARPSISPSAS
jgi:hypothetical protein